MDNAALQAKLAAILDAFPAKSALHCVDLTSGEVMASLRAETRVVSASTIKVALLFCALEDVIAGKLALDAHIPIAPEDFREDTRVFEPEYRQDGCSLWEMLYWMIVLSDNTATNAVISTLGYARVNAYCARLGLENTACQRKMLDWTAVKEGRNNYTSPLDQFRLYEMLYRGEILNAQLRAVVFNGDHGDWLLSSRVEKARLRRSFPPKAYEMFAPRGANSPPARQSRAIRFHFGGPSGPPNHPRHLQPFGSHGFCR